VEEPEVRLDKQQENISPAPSWPPSGGAGGCLQDSLVLPAGTPDQREAGTRGGGEISPRDFDAIRTAIRGKYAEVAISAAGKFGYPTGKTGAEALGYDSGVIRQAPSRLLESFCGVGNPFLLGEIRSGEVVLDFGCGAGFDLYVASRTVGKNGRVCGVDLTQEMVKLAARNLAAAGATNFEVKKIDSEEIPYPDNFFDVVTSNGVINLSPRKAACFRELYRVLKPGGRVQFADVVLENDLPAGLADSPEAWSQWIGGAVPVRDQMRFMEDAGFAGVTFKGTTGFRTSQHTIGALFKGYKPALK
jgi:arsenite methyltransferase